MRAPSSRYQRSSAVRRAGAPAACCARRGKTLPNMAAALVGSSLGAAALLLLPPPAAHGAGIAMLARETAFSSFCWDYALRHGELIRPSLRRARFDPRRLFADHAFRPADAAASGRDEPYPPRCFPAYPPEVRARLFWRAWGFAPARSCRSPRPSSASVRAFSRSAARPSAQSKRRAVKPPIASCQRVAIAFSLAVGAAVFAFALALTARFAHGQNRRGAGRRACACKSAVFLRRAPSF